MLRIEYNHFEGVENCDTTKIPKPLKLWGKAGVGKPFSVRPYTKKNITLRATHESVSIYLAGRFYMKAKNLDGFHSTLGTLRRRPQFFGEETEFFM